MLEKIKIIIIVMIGILLFNMFYELYFYFAKSLFYFIKNKNLA